ncbi:MAG: hypothetical protein V4488_07965 [Pseudomonadota bacterium]
MNQRFLKAILQIGGDPADELWIWLVKRGPHGTSFTWSHTRNEPAGYVGIRHLEEIAAEMTASIPDFVARARSMVRIAVTSDLSELARRAIQVAAVVGGKEELQLIRQLTEREDPEIAAEAKAFFFYLKRCTK